MSAAEGQEVMRLTLSTLKSLRNDSSFDQFWQRICASCDELDTQKTTLPRRHKVRHLDDGAAPTFHDTIEEHYRVTLILLQLVYLIASISLATRPMGKCRLSFLKLLHQP